MKNKHGIPENELDEIIRRDRHCVYCGVKLIYPFDIKNRVKSATIEHLNHKADWDSVKSYVTEGRSTKAIIVMCCGGCNSSRGSKSLIDWFTSNYCKEKAINYDRVSDVVQKYMREFEKFEIV